MPALDDFREFVQRDQPIAPLTWFRLGGNAEYLARPRNLDQLVSLVKTCLNEHIQLHVLSGGSNVLVRDEGVRGVVIHMESPAFSDVSLDGRVITAGAAVPLTALISQTARAGLAGLEVMTGIPGTVGGAILGNAGSRQDAIGAYVREVEVIDPAGNHIRRDRDDLSFGYRSSNIDDPIIIAAKLELTLEDTETVVKRMRRTWIIKKETQPYGHQSSGMIFKDPEPDISARMLIDQAGLKGARVGGAEVSERHSNFIVANPGATASDVLALVELIRARVADQLKYELEPLIRVW